MLFSYKILALAVLSGTQVAIAAQPPATLYTEEPCTGESTEVPADDACHLLPVEFRKNINAAKIPDDVVCDFYRDTKCSPENAVLTGVESPGICQFSEWEIQNQTVSVHCFDASEE